MITVYAAKAEDYSTNGIMVLDPYCMSANINERLNGEYVLVMELAINERTVNIANEMVVKTPAPVRFTPRLNIYASAQIEIYKVATNGGRLNLRTKPSTSAGKILHAYKPGTEIVVTDKSNVDWYAVVTPDGRNGYMYADYLKYVRTDGGVPADGKVIEEHKTKDQLFRIQSVKQTLDSIQVEALHISYDLRRNYVRTANVDGKSGAEAFGIVLNAAETPHEFRAYSDMTLTINGDLGRKSPIAAILSDGGLIDQAGGELLRDNFDLYWSENIGLDRGVSIAYRKNMAGMEVIVDTNDLVTRIIPVGFDKKNNPIFGDPVDSKYINEYAQPYVLEYEFKDVKIGNPGMQSESDVRGKLRELANSEYGKGIDLPTITASVDYVDLQNTEIAQTFAAFNGVFLGDTVRIRHEDYGLDFETKVVAYEWDCLRREYVGIELGSRRASLSDVRISPSQIGNGTIAGRKLAVGAVSGTELGEGSVTNEHVSDDGIAAKKVYDLDVEAIAAIRAEIRKLVAGEITTDRLYADIAIIAAAQITAANIEKANIQWAEIENLAAEIAKVVNAEIKKAEIDWAQIKNAEIDAADITNLTAAVAVIVKAEIALAEIDWAYIKNVKVDTAQIKLGAITSALIAAGAIGTAQIADGSITSAKVVELSADVIKSGTLSTERLLIKGAGGLFYEINATAGGLTASQLNEEQYKNAISGTALVAHSITAEQIASKTITANEIMSNTITAAEIDVANLFASSAVIAALDNYILRTETIEALKGSLDVWAEEKIRLSVGEMKLGGTNYLLESDRDITTAEYFVGEYSFSENLKPKAGQKVTIRIWGDLGKGRTNFGVWNTNSYIQIGALTDNKDGTYSGTFEWKVENPDWPQYGVTETSQKGLRIYALPQGGTATTFCGEALCGAAMCGEVDPESAAMVSTIERIKMEIGDFATDWSPHPDDSAKAIEKLSAELNVQAGRIDINAAAIQTAQDTANAAQNAADNNATNLAAVEKQVTEAKVSIDALNEEIDLRVTTEAFNALGKTVSDNTAAITLNSNSINQRVTDEVAGLQSQIDVTSEEVLLLAGRTVGGTNYLLDSAKGISTSAYFMGEYRFANGLKPKAGEKVTIRIWGSLGAGRTGFGIWNTNGYIRIGTLTDNGDGTYSGTFTWQIENPAWPEYGETEESQTGIQIYALPNDSSIKTVSTIEKIKLERGDHATDWSPNPNDPASGVNAGGVVRVDQTGVHMSGGTIEMETSDGDEFIHIRNDGISASSLTASNVTPRYDGPGTLYVNPNATSAQIAAGNYYRSLADAFAALNYKWVGKTITINLAAGMTEYGTVSLQGISGGCWVQIMGSSASPAKLVGRLNLYFSASPVSVSGLNIDTESIGINVEGCQTASISGCVITGPGTGVTTSRCIRSARGSNVNVSDCEMYNCYRSLFMEMGGVIAGSGCKGNCRVGATRAVGYLSGTMPCDSTAWDKFTYGGLIITEDVTVDQGSMPTPEAAPMTAVFDYLLSDSYRGGWSYFTDGDPRQGYNGNDIYGVIWFDAAAIKAAIGSRTVRQASLRLHMHTGVGRGVAVSVQMYGSNVSSARTAAPALTTSYGTIGTTNPGEIHEITIPVQAVKDIVSGTIQALVLKSDDTELHKDRDYSRNYARFSGSTSADASNCPRLTVMYQ